MANESKGGIILDTTTKKSKGGPVKSLETTYSNAGYVTGVALRWVDRPTDNPVIISAVIDGVRRSIVGYLETSVDIGVLNGMFETLDVVADTHGSSIDSDNRAIYLIKA